MLVDNAFYLLGVAPTDNDITVKAKLAQLLEEQPDKKEELERIYNKLVKSKLRIMEEISWFTDLPKGKIKQVVAGEQVKASNGLDGLLILLWGMAEIDKPKDFAKTFTQICNLFAEENINTLLERINDNRAIAEFTPLATENELSIGWEKLSNQVTQSVILILKNRGFDYYKAVMEEIAKQGFSLVDKEIGVGLVKEYLNLAKVATEQQAVKLQALLKQLEVPDFSFMEKLEEVLMDRISIVKPLAILSPKDVDGINLYFSEVVALAKGYYAGGNYIYARALVETIVAVYDYTGSKYKEQLLALGDLQQQAKTKVKEVLVKEKESQLATTAKVSSQEVDEIDGEVGEEALPPKEVAPVAQPANLLTEEKVVTANEAKVLNPAPMNQQERVVKENSEEKESQLATTTKVSLQKVEEIDGEVGEEALPPKEVAPVAQPANLLLEEKMAAANEAKVLNPAPMDQQERVVKENREEKVTNNTIKLAKVEVQPTEKEKMVASHVANEIKPQQSSRKPLVIGSLIVVGLCILGGISYSFFHKSTEEATTVSSKAVNIAKSEDNKADKPIGDYAQAVNQFSLAGISIGDNPEIINSVLGKAEAVKNINGEDCYTYPAMDVYVGKGIITNLVSNSPNVYTKKGIHQGDSLEKVLSTYGKENLTVTDYKGLKLYEYKFAVVNNNMLGILRFAINKEDKVEYISARIAPNEEQNNGVGNDNSVEGQVNKSTVNEEHKSTPVAKPKPQPSVSPAAAKSAAIAAIQRYYGSSNGTQVSDFSVNSVSGNSVVLSFTVTKRVSVGYGKFKGESSRYTGEVVNTGNGWRVNSIY